MMPLKQKFTEVPCYK